jgi:hypothetical protein
MSQVIKKFIGDNEVGAAKIRLENNSIFKARNAANSADIDILKVDASDNILILGSGAPGTDNTFTWGSTSAGFSFIYGYYLSSPDENHEIGLDGSIAMTTDGGINFSDSSSTGIIFNPASTSYIGLVGQTAATTLRFYEDSGTNYVAFKANTTIASDVTWTLPIADGSANQVLKTNGSGVLSWTTVSSGASNEKETFTLSAGDITNGYVDLANVARTDSIDFVISGLVSREGTDYTVSYTGGAGGNTRITFSGHTPTLAASDVVTVKYEF